MTDKAGGPGIAGPGTAQLLENWVTIWHSELAALAGDREVQEAIQRLIDAWAAQALLAARAIGAAVDAARHAGTAAPPGTAAAGYASDAHAPSAPTPDGRDAVIAELLARVAELERRLGEREPS